MSKAIANFDTNHEGMIHDTQFNYYGNRLASCDSNGCVEISEIDNGSLNPATKATIQAHQGPAW